MRLPRPIAEHPLESLIAGLLLAALLFVSGGPEAAQRPVAHGAQTLAEKM